MKHNAVFVLILISLLLSSSPAGANPPAQTGKRYINEKDLFEFAWIGDPQISADGSQVVFYRVVPNQERSGYSGSIWLVATSGNAAPVELIVGKSVNGARWSPDGQSLLYRRDGQLALFSLPTKESRTLTNVPGGAGGAVWSPDGHHVAFLSSTPDAPAAPKTVVNVDDRQSDVHVITEANYHSG